MFSSCLRFPCPRHVAASPQCSSGSSLSAVSLLSVTDTECNSNGISENPAALSDVDLLPVPSCFVCQGLFAASGPFSRCTLQCRRFSVHLQCITDLVHHSQSVTCPACNAQSPSSVDFLTFTPLLYSPCGSPCRRVHDLFISSVLCLFSQCFSLPSARTLRVLGSVSPLLRRSLPFLHTGPRPHPV